MSDRTLDREELLLLHETLSYAVKRTYSEGKKVRLRDLLGRVEERLLDQSARVAWPFGITHPEEEAILNAVEIFCEAHELPLSAPVSREKANRVRTLVKRFQRPPGFLSRIARLFGRKFVVA